MKNKLITAIVLLAVLPIIGFAGCRGGDAETSQKQIAEVSRGDLLITVLADGNLDMPRDVQLKFGTPGTVKAIYVKEGQKVKEGTLLAKLDDTTQKLAVASAQYNVELAMNELVEKIHPALMGYPGTYPDTSTILRVEQAQDELAQVQKFLEQSSYQEAAAELRLAIHDLDASYKMLNVPEITVSLQEYDEFGSPVENYPDISRAIKRMEQDIAGLNEIQTLLEQGKYDDARVKLNTAQYKLKDTHLLVKSLSGRIIVSQRIGECCQQLATQDSSTGATGLMPLPYPDTSTSLSWLRQVEEELQKIQACKDPDSCDALEISTLLRMAQHDVDMSRTILENNEMIFRGGVNLKALRAYNLNLQIAEQDLKRYKDELMKTEILAPFDGTIVDIGVKENDQLSAFDYSSKTAVYLVDTHTVEMDGVVDEIDIYKVKVGQEAIITVDALPDVELKGTVTFISPFGSRTTGVVEFPVTIALDPTETELKGGLTATADIIVLKHENVLLIPNRSIKGSPGDYWVDVVLDEKTMTTEKRQVELGAQNDRISEVISGLGEGERIIVEATRGRLPTSP
ncbi:MAG: efflux RND transporter periplasmic adaptor subunit [Dehalococcoidia bacterium]|nr:efflux RND transporter periplasmic adaptor subunit [Dehalococcoidia bacterium]